MNDEQSVRDRKTAIRPSPATMAIGHLQSVSVELQIQIQRLEELTELYDTRVAFTIVAGVLKMAQDVTNLVCAGLKKQI